MFKAILVPLKLSLGTGTITCLFASPVLAQVTSDGTVNTQVNQNGNIAEITGGETRGGNLFHSFQDFSIPTGNEAFFNNANAIENIFSRVTGGNISNIDGAIKANGSASLFLLNPAGIIFGENARLDIGGSFYGSSASSILFEDGEFSATDLTNPPLLTVNAPVGLNLRDLPGDVINHANNNLGLRVNSGETISLTGNELSFDGGIVTAPGGRVEVLGDKVSLTNNATIDVSSETGEGTVLIGGDYQGRGNLNATRTYIDDTVTINADAFSEGNGGRVIVWGDEVTGFYGNISVRGGDISGNGGFVEVSGKEHLIFRGNVDTTATNGFTGTLLLDPTNIIIANGSGDSSTDGENTFSGNNSNTPGSILSTPLSEINDDAPTTIFESELEELSGDTNIILQATNDITIQDLANDELNLASGDGIIAFTADADADGVGDFVMEDNISIFNEETFELDPADTIRTNGRSIAISGANLTIGSIDTSLPLANDNAGSTIETAQVISSDSGTNVESIAGFLSEFDDVDTYQIFLTGNGTFSASTVGGTTVDTQLFLFDAAGFGIYANDDQVIAVEQQSILPANNPLTPANPGIYYLSVTSFGNNPVSDGGLIFPRAISIEDPNDIAIAEGINSSTGEGGNSPLIGFENDFFGEIGEYQVNLTGVEGTQANFVEAPQVMGDSGSIILNATNGNVNLGGVINSSTAVMGNAGDITINASDTVSIDNAAIFSSIEFFGIGDAGNINITTTNLSLTESFIEASAVGQGDPSGIFISAEDTISLDNSIIRNATETTTIGGSEGINITTDRLFLTNGSQIITPTFGLIDSGDVNITAFTEFSFDGFNPLDPSVPSSIFTIVNNPDTEGNGGDINIAAGIFSLNNGAVITSSTNGIGNGGDITINATNFSLNNNSSIRSDSGVTAQGDGGDITINATGIVSLEGGSVFFDGEEFPGISSISSSTFGLGNSGNISISAESIALSNAFISTDVTEDLFIDSIITLFDVEGNVLAENDDIADLSLSGEENVNPFNSFLEFDFTEDGTYTIEVSTFGFFNEDGTVESAPVFSGQSYGLQVSIENHPVSENISNSIAKIEPNNSLETAQNIDSSFGINLNPDIKDSETVPSVSILAEGDGTFDYYSFSATDGSLGIFDIDEISPNTPFQNVLGGNITLNASGDITLDNESRISASSVSRGRGGNVSLSTPESLLIRNSSIEASSTGLANSGSVSIDAENINLENQGLISSSTVLGNGSLIDLNVQNLLSLRDDSRISAEATGQTGDAGNIDIDAGSVVAYPNLNEGDGNDIVTSAINGAGGDIDITTEALLGFGLNTRRANLGNNTNDIDVFSDSGLNGDFSLTILNVDLSESATELSDNVVEQETITAQTCSANRKAVAQSSLSINGKGDIATPPGEPIDSSNIVIDGKFDSTFVVPAPIETSKGTIQPARGVKVTESGEVILTAYRTNNSGDRITETRYCSKV